jgi:rhodanese-related sulfurtransferase
LKSSAGSPALVRRDCPAALRQAGLLLAVSLAAAAVLWAARSDRLPLRADATVYELEVPAPLVTPAEALSMFDEGDRIFVDTRAGDVDETIPGSFFIRAGSFDDDLWDAGEYLYPEDPVLLYGSGDLASVVLVADLLLERGYEDLVILRGGLSAWRSAGGAIGEPLPAPETGDSP